MRYQVKIVLVILLVFLGSCSYHKRYLNQVLRIIEHNSIRRDSIDWRDYRDSIRKVARGDKTLEDTYATIRVALSLLGDNHSQFITKSTAKLVYDTTRHLPKIRSGIIKGVGFFTLPGFSGNNRLQLNYTNELLSHIRRLDQNDLAGWIIDLRNNGGGSMWPMLLAIGPFIGNGPAGYFVDVKGKEYAWIHNNGVVSFDSTVTLKIDSTYKLHNHNKRVAILVNKNTGSSGEAIVLSFRGLPDTKIIGQKTYGLTTGNTGIVLKDSSILYLTTSVFADRDKVKYGRSITPDLITASPVEDGIKWILGEI